ncbi:class II aldolase/adducin family protein [Benzoatithermus flavus]|uniref:Class II aldolase/adducin family protein n=1 Tax=Benzoatithermus flavus TaxID=3108223 RepID=A0ABU8XNJ8_9PROT
MRPTDLEALERFSAAIGREPAQVQAAGGNTSLKAEGILWVKASGFWLADAETRDIFVPVRLDRILGGIARDLADPVSAAVVGEANPMGLRPSIETTLHALLPHRVVVHTHSVRTIALAIREDAEALVASRLHGLRWAFIPYCKPGLPLTRRTAEALRQRPADVLILGNHGLVVGGDSLGEAESLLEEVERRLDAPAEPAAAGDLTALAAAAAGLNLRPVRHERAHGLAMNERWAAWCSRGSLYPDHVIFLGPGAVLLPDTGEAGRVAVAAAAQRASKLFILPGAGVLVPTDTTPSADELALCLALVMERVPADAKLRYLTAEDEAELLSWDAEKYRQALAQARQGG